MEWWRWLAACVEALLLAMLVALWYDDLKQKPTWSIGRSRRAASWAALSIPVGFVAVLFAPLWLGLVLIAVPALVVFVMMLAS